MMLKRIKDLQEELKKANSVSRKKEILKEIKKLKMSESCIVKS